MIQKESDVTDIKVFEDEFDFLDSEELVLNMRKGKTKVDRIIQSSSLPFVTTFNVFFMLDFCLLAAAEKVLFVTATPDKKLMSNVALALTTKSILYEQIGETQKLNKIFSKNK